MNKMAYIDLMLLLLIWIVYCIYSVATEGIHHRDSYHANSNSHNHIMHHHKHHSHRNITHRFYIYDTDDWHNISIASWYRRDPNEIMDTSFNYGAGPLVNLTAGLFHTDQYQLYSIMYNRLLRDPRRVHDPNKATTYIIPYDIASDTAFYKHCVKSVGRCYDFRKCPLAPRVEELLMQSPYFLRHGGHDHLLIVGMNYAMDHYIGKPKCKSLLSTTCTNCTKLAIDDYSFLHSDDSGIKEKGDHWHAVPFPSDFHWVSEIEQPFPWMNEDRPILVSYTGSAASYYNPARRIRTSIIHYCELHPDLCAHASYGVNGTRDSFKVDGYNPLDVSKNSVFCFQPIGDLMTRKGLFDSLSQGCIPVMFDLLTANVMYTWHWSESFWNQISIQYPFHPTAFRYFDPVLALQELWVNNRTEILHKMELIRERVFELQYSLEGRIELNGPLTKKPWLNMNTIHRYNNTKYIDSGNYNSIWPVDKHGNYMMDAYDIIISQVLDWHTGNALNVRNATVPECWNGVLNVTLNKCVPTAKAA